MSKELHIAIIMDGNGRWAENRGLKRTAGHEKGSEVAREISKFCSSHSDIKYLTLYAFSTENWSRPKSEVEFLMKLLSKYLDSELENYLKANIRFIPIGDLSKFSKNLTKSIENLQNKTAHCDGLVQYMALNYGSKDEISRAIAKSKSIDELGRNLDCPVDVDILIRTGGEQRLSNFMLWQAAYAELFFSKTLWPDFSTDELEQIVSDFRLRERRFGGV